MDLTISCSSADVSSAGYNSVEVICYNIDENIFETSDVCKSISITDYISYLSHKEKVEMLEELVSEVGDDVILDNYTNEELLGRLDMDDILDYFQKNLINHV